MHVGLPWAMTTSTNLGKVKVTIEKLAAVYEEQERRKGSICSSQRCHRKGCSGQIEDFWVDAVACAARRQEHEHAAFAQRAPVPLPPYV